MWVYVLEIGSSKGVERWFRPMLIDISMCAEDWMFESAEEILLYRTFVALKEEDMRAKHKDIYFEIKTSQKEVDPEIEEGKLPLGYDFRDKKYYYCDDYSNDEDLDDEDFSELFPDKLYYCKECRQFLSFKSSKCKEHNVGEIEL